MTTAKVPPHDTAAEQALLGALMLSPEALAATISYLRPDLFYNTRHQAILRAITHLNEAGSLIDQVTVAARLESSNNLDMVGGRAYLLDITSVVPTTANALQYTRIVIEHARRRAIISGATLAATSAYDLDDPNTILEELHDATNLSDPTRSNHTPFDQLTLASALTAEKRVHHPGITGISTGFTVIDRAIDGMCADQLLLLAARPSVGKSALAENIALNAAKLGHRILFLELEQSAENVVRRLICSQALLDSQCVRQGLLTASQLQHYQDTATTLGKLPIIIDDTAALPYSAIPDLVRTHEPELLIVDYLQLLDTPAETQRHLGIAAVSRTLKLCAKNHHIPVLALSQLSRDITKVTRRPQLSDLKESGALEQDADIVMFIHPTHHEPSIGGVTPPPDYTAIVAKNRNGPIVDIPLVYNPPWTRFFTAYQTR